jgi:hypothetical protein
MYNRKANQAKKACNYYLYGLAIASEVNPPQHNASRVSISTWDDLKNVGSDYCVYVGISRVSPSDRLGKHQCKKGYITLADIMGYTNFDPKQLVMYVLSDHINYKVSDWPLVMSLEAKLINDFKNTHGHEPLFQLPPPDAGIKAIDALDMKREIAKNMTSQYMNKIKMEVK